MIVYIVYIADKDDFIANFVVYMLFYIYKSTGLIKNDFDIQNCISFEIIDLSL